MTTFIHGIYFLNDFNRLTIMSEKEQLKPDRNWLKSRIHSMRTATIEYQVAESRVSAELTLFYVETQEKLIDTLERSIESQDRFSKNANFLAWGAFVFAGVQIIVALMLRTG